ncbi:hypothetical protein ACQP2K_16110 [Microbispora siamensis]
MRGHVLPRVLLLAGGIAALGGGSVLAVYLSSVGLDKADKLASVIGLFVGLAGLAVGVWGLLLTRRQEAHAPANAPGTVSHEVHNEISGGTIHGPVVQGHTVQGHTVQGHTVQGHTVQGHTVQGHTVQGHTVQGHTVQGHTVQGHTVQGHTVQGHTVQGHTVQGHTVDGRTVNGPVVPDDRAGKG